MICLRSYSSERQNRFFYLVFLSLGSGVGAEFRGFYLFGQGDVIGFVDEVFVVQDGVVLGDVEEVEDEFEGASGVQYQLFVVYGQIFVFVYFYVLRVYYFDGFVLFGEVVAVVVEVEVGDGDFARDYGVYGGAVVAYYQQEFGVGEQARQVDGGFEREGVFVVEYAGRFVVFGDYFQDEGLYGGVQYFVRYVRFVQSQFFSFRFGLGLAYGQYARDDARFFVVAYFGVGVEYGAYQRGVVAGYVVYEDERYGFVVAVFYVVRVYYYQVFLFRSYGSSGVSRFFQYRAVFQYLLFQLDGQYQGQGVVGRQQRFSYRQAYVGFRGTRLCQRQVSGRFAGFIFGERDRDIRGYVLYRFQWQQMGACRFLWQGICYDQRQVLGFSWVFYLF